MGLFKKKEVVMPFPPTRFLQFFYVIKENFLLLFYTSITYFIFTLPLIYILLSTYIRYSNQLNTNVESNDMYMTLISSAMLIIPTALLHQAANVGMHNIIKNLTYNEPVGYKDFFISIKENYLKLSPLLFVDAIFSGIIVTNYAVYLFTDINPLFKLIALLISIFIFILVKLIKPFYMTQYAIFDNSKIQIIKNSIAFTFSNLIKNISIYLLSNILIIILFFLPEQMRIIDMVISIILGGAFSVLITHLNTLNIIEKYIDKNEYKNIYHKGLSDFYKEEI